MNLAQCLSERDLGAISFDRAHAAEPKPPRGHVPEPPRRREHEAVDLSAYASHRIREIHRAILDLVEREKRPYSIDEMERALHNHYGRRRVMIAACYLVNLGCLVRRDAADGRRSTYGPKAIG